MNETRGLTVESFAQIAESVVRSQSKTRRTIPINNHWVNLEDLVSWSNHKDTVVVDVK